MEDQACGTGLMGLIGMGMSRGVGLSTKDVGGQIGPGELRGRSPAEIEEMIPQSWGRSPTSGPGGTRYTHPENRGEQIRVMPGNANDPNPIKRGPYARISRAGKVSEHVPLKGNPTIEP
jgi:hypothetical protein